MSNPLKRGSPFEEVDDIRTPTTFDLGSFIAHQQDRWSYGSDFIFQPEPHSYGEPNNYTDADLFGFNTDYSQFPPLEYQHGDIGSIQSANFLQDSGGNITANEGFIGNQMTPMSLVVIGDNINSHLQDGWARNTDLQTFDSHSSRLTPIQPQENLTSPSVAPDPGPLTPECVTTPLDEEITCYGMLHDIEVKLIGDLQTINTKLNGSLNEYEHFNIREREDRIIVYFKGQDDQKELGNLRSMVEKTLKPLLEETNLDFDVLATVSDLKEIILRAYKPSEAIVKVDVNIYGPRSLAPEVGRTLSSGKLWLQKPAHMRSSVVYNNPHFLNLNIDVSEEQLNRDVGRIENQEPLRKQYRQERLFKMVQEVYKSLDNFRHLNAADAGNRVTRKLLIHQREALGFMLERESGNINDRYSLWQTIVLEDGKEEYRHKITKAKTKSGVKPDERGGGILADEMGMGKTLSALALIAKTIDDGREWAQHKNDNAKEKDAVKYSRSTLVVVPSALLVTNWKTEIEQHLIGDLTVVKYHGPNRPKDVDILADSDIVVTTYSTLTTEFQAEPKSAHVHRVGWYRVVLDEAHIIRRQATKFYRSCADLHAKSRWCLTGTPFQNKLSDIGALFAFIRAEPFSIAHAFRKWIEIPFEQNPDDWTVVRDRLVMILDAFCLRRTKDIISLPPPQQRIRKLEFSAAELKQYENTKRALMRMIDHSSSTVQGGTPFSRFQAEQQLRLFCNHGTFQNSFSWKRSYQDNYRVRVSKLGQKGDVLCCGCEMPMPILGSSRGDSFHEKCSHVLCSECLEPPDTPNTSGQAPHCPICSKSNPGRRVLDSGQTVDLDNGDSPATLKTSRDNMDHYFNVEGYSTKIAAVIQDVSKHLRTSKRHVFPPSETLCISNINSIIFSCWTRTLYLLSKHLDEARIPYLCVDGTCPPRQRQSRLNEFANDKDMPVLIMTTGTGGFGLNITCANRVFILEPQWNPGVESQAIARAIRLGQESEVSVTRYLIKGSFEEEVLRQQQVKTRTGAAVFGEMADIIDDEDGTP